MKDMISRQFAIAHVTLELETGEDTANGHCVPDTQRHAPRAE